jgi:hypothetical protein
VIITFAEADRALRNAMIRDTIAVTRRSTVLQRYAEQYADLLVAGTNTFPFRVKHCVVHDVRLLTADADRSFVSSIRILNSVRCHMLFLVSSSKPCC